MAREFKREMRWFTSIRWRGEGGEGVLEKDDGGGRNEGGAKEVSGEAGERQSDVTHKIIAGEWLPPCNDVPSNQV